MRRIGLLVAIIIFVFCENIFAWDDKRTHPELTDEAIEESGLHEYLKNYLNLPQGTDTKLADETIREWIKKDSFCEDQPIFSRNL